MEIFWCIILGYTLGSISPSYLAGRSRGIDMRRTGTKNLGASNTFIHLGRLWGIFVMLLDIAKATIAVRLCAYMFPELPFAAYLGGAGAVLGHCFPAYIGFVGGRGLASLGGFVLGISPALFVLMLIVCTALAVLLNYGCIIALSASVLFPFLAWRMTGSASVLLISAVPCACVFVKHTENIRRIRAGKETPLRDFVGKYVAKR